MKQCKKCNEVKFLTEFYKEKTGKDGLRCQCKTCDRIIHKKWYQNTKEIRAKYRQAKKQYYQQYYQNTKEIRAKYRTNRLKTNSNFKLACYLRNRLNMAIKNHQKSGSAVKDLGCTIQELKIYLESKFTEGMNWSNYNIHGWHIDHIVPLASFDLTDRKQFLKANHYTNLQPMWAKDNLSKGARRMI